MSSKPSPEKPDRPRNPRKLEKPELSTTKMKDFKETETREVEAVIDAAPVAYHKLPQRIHAGQSPEDRIVHSPDVVAPPRRMTRGGKGPLSSPADSTSTPSKSAGGVKGPHARKDDIPRPSAGFATSGSSFTYSYGDREEMDKVVEKKRAATKESQQSTQQDDDWEDEDQDDEDMVDTMSKKKVQLQTLQKGLPKPKSLGELDQKTLIYRDQVPQMFEAMFRKKQKIKDDTAEALKLAYAVKAQNLQQGIVADNRDDMIEIERNVEVGGVPAVVNEMVPRIPYADKRGIIGPWHPAIPHSLNNMEKHGRKARIVPGEVDPNGRLAGRLLVQWHRPRMVEKLVLHLQYACEFAEPKIKLPWDDAIHRLSPGSSGPAGIQWLNKTRDTLISEGHLIPPMMGKESMGKWMDKTVRGFVRDMDSPDPTATRALYWGEEYVDKLRSLTDHGIVRGSGMYRKIKAQGGTYETPVSINPKPRRSRLPGDVVNRHLEYKQAAKSETPNKRKTRSATRIKLESEDEADPAELDSEEEYVPDAPPSKKRKTRDRNHRLYRSTSTPEIVESQDLENLVGAPSQMSRVVTLKIASNKLAKFPAKSFGKAVSTKTTEYGDFDEDEFPDVLAVKDSTTVIDYEAPTTGYDVPDLSYLGVDEHGTMEQWRQALRDGIHPKVNGKKHANPTFDGLPRIATRAGLFDSDNGHSHLKSIDKLEGSPDNLSTHGRDGGPFGYYGSTNKRSYASNSSVHPTMSMRDIPPRHSRNGQSEIGYEPNFAEAPYVGGFQNGYSYHNGSQVNGYAYASPSQLHGSSVNGYHFTPPPEQDNHPPIRSSSNGLMPSGFSALGSSDRPSPEDSYIGMMDDGDELSPMDFLPITRVPGGRESSWAQRGAGNAAQGGDERDAVQLANGNLEFRQMLAVAVRERQSLVLGNPDDPFLSPDLTFDTAGGLTGEALSATVSHPAEADNDDDDGWSLNATPGVSSAGHFIHQPGMIYDEHSASPQPYSVYRLGGRATGGNNFAFGTLGNDNDGNVPEFSPFDFDEIDEADEDPFRFY